MVARMSCEHTLYVNDPFPPLWVLWRGTCWKRGCDRRAVKGWNVSAMRRPCRCSLLFTFWLVFVSPLRDQERSRPFTVVFYLPELRCHCNFSVNVSGEFTIDQIKISHMWNGVKNPPEVGRKDVIWRQKFFVTSARHLIWQMQTKPGQGCYKKNKLDKKKWTVNLSDRQLADGEYLNKDATTKNKLAILLMKGEHLTHVIQLTLLDFRECSKVVWLTEHTFERCSVSTYCKTKWPAGRKQGTSCR